MRFPTAMDAAQVTSIRSGKVTSPTPLRPALQGLAAGVVTRPGSPASCPVLGWRCWPSSVAERLCRREDVASGGFNGAMFGLADPITPIATALAVAIAGGQALAKITRRNRLRNRITRDLALFAALDGAGMGERAVWLRRAAEEAFAELRLLDEARTTRLARFRSAIPSVLRMVGLVAASVGLAGLLTLSANAERSSTNLAELSQLIAALVVVTSWFLFPVIRRWRHLFRQRRDRRRGLGGDE